MPTFCDSFLKMRTFSIITLGCKVNQYESEQIAQLLRDRGLVQVEDGPAWEPADLCIVNSCSVTIQASSKSRQLVRRATQLPVLQESSSGPAMPAGAPSVGWGRQGGRRQRGRVVVTGCWATGSRAEAAALPGVDAVIGHRDNLAGELARLLDQWLTESSAGPPASPGSSCTTERPSGASQPEAASDERSTITGVIPAAVPTAHSESQDDGSVNGKTPPCNEAAGAQTLPLLSGRQRGHQRAMLKVQDGCDAHCTYCIIPKLRPVLWSKPVDEVLAEARNLVAAGHQELVLTGIFLGAYGQSTAVRRRQVRRGAAGLGELVDALCREVPGLRRLRLSSLEPADLGDELLAALRRWPRVVAPHFHLPLQSGSNLLLRRMNRQYTREQYLDMVQRVREAFDRPALTTDIIVGFPGETEEQFGQTLDVVDQTGFIHVHAFAFSPRPGTPAARWTKQFVHGPVVNQRIDLLRQRAASHSLAFRRQFVGQELEVLVERTSEQERRGGLGAVRHGRTERYFAVHFEGDESLVGRAVRVRVDRVTPLRTWGSLVGIVG